MNEKSTLNLKGCQHLRKVLIDSKVSYKGIIDLTDTPIEKKIDVNTVPRTKGTFKTISNGISANPLMFNRIKLKKKTAEMSTQTDPVEILPLEKLNLIKYDKETVAILKDALFWYEGLENPGRIEFLKQRQKDIEARLNVEGINRFSDPNVKALAEHVLLISKNILDSYEHIKDVKSSEIQTGNIAEPITVIKTPETATKTPSPTPPPTPIQTEQSWNSFRIWLLKEIVEKTKSEVSKFKNNIVFTDRGSERYMSDFGGKTFDIMSIKDVRINGSFETSEPKYLVIESKINPADPIYKHTEINKGLYWKLSFEDINKVLIIGWNSSKLSPNPTWLYQSSLIQKVIFIETNNYKIEIFKDTSKFTFFKNETVKNLLLTPNDNKNPITEKELERFMLSLEATIGISANKYKIFPTYSDSVLFDDYFNRNTGIWCGSTNETNMIGNNAYEKGFKLLFREWLKSTGVEVAEKQAILIKDDTFERQNFFDPPDKNWRIRYVVSYKDGSEELFVALLPPTRDKSIINKDHKFKALMIEGKKPIKEIKVLWLYHKVSTKPNLTHGRDGWYNIHKDFYNNNSDSLDVLYTTTHKQSGDNGHCLVKKPKKGTFRSIKGYFVLDNFFWEID